MLEIDVSKRLRDFNLEVKLNIPEGEILMLVGDNGCGKTTLLNLVAGLDQPRRRTDSARWKAALRFLPEGERCSRGAKHRIRFSELRALSPHERL